MVKKKLLMSFGDDADSASVHLKAAGLPRTRNHVLIPIDSMKDNEVYAPNYKDGEKVVLIRHPHAQLRPDLLRLHLRRVLQHVPRPQDPRVQRMTKNLLDRMRRS